MGRGARPRDDGRVQGAMGRASGALWSRATSRRASSRSRCALALSSSQAASRRAAACWRSSSRPLCSSSTRARASASCSASRFSARARKSRWSSTSSRFCFSRSSASSLALASVCASSWSSSICARSCATSSPSPGDGGTALIGTTAERFAAGVARPRSAPAAAALRLAADESRLERVADCGASALRRPAGVSWFIGGGRPTAQHARRRGARRGKPLRCARRLDADAITSLSLCDTAAADDERVGDDVGAASDGSAGRGEPGERSSSEAAAGRPRTDGAPHVSAKYGWDDCSISIGGYPQGRTR